MSQELRVPSLCNQDNPQPRPWELVNLCVLSKILEKGKCIYKQIYPIEYANMIAMLPVTCTACSTETADKAFSNQISPNDILNKIQHCFFCDNKD